MFPRIAAAVSSCFSVVVIAGVVSVSSALLVIASPAAASPILADVTYRVLDHPDGNLAPPFYALRLDNLGGTFGENYTFSSETNGAFLTVRYEDDADGSLTIAGTVYGGRVVDHQYVAPQLWDLDFQYSMVAGGDVLEATPGSGMGTITAMGINGIGVGGFGAGQIIGLIDKANKYGVSFLLDTGHRTADPNTITAHGWLTHNNAVRREPSQDWFFTVGEPIPEPGTALLMGLGLAGLAARRSDSRSRR